MKRSKKPEEVKRMYVNGTSLDEISDHLGISKKYVMHILRGFGYSFKRVYVKTDKEEAINSIQEYYKKTNSISIYEYDKKGYKPSSVSIKNLFGSWKNAVSQAGLSTEGMKEDHHPSRKIYTKEEILSIMKLHFSNDKEVIKRKRYIEKNYEPSVNIIVSHFKSWREMLLALGMDINTKANKDK